MADLWAPPTPEELANLGGANPSDADPNDLWAPPTQEERKNLNTEMMSSPSRHGASGSWKEETPGLMDRATSFGLGVAESGNPLSVIRGANTAGMALGKAMFDKPRVEMKKDIFGNPVPIDTRSFGELYSEANKEQKIPPMDIKSVGGGLPGEVGEAFKKLPEKEYEAGVVVGGVAQLGRGGLKALRGSPLKQAARLQSKVRSTLRALTGKSEGAAIEGLLDRPEQVRALIESGNLKAVDLAEDIGNELKAVKKSLGKRIEEFRDAAKRDESDLMPSSIIRNKLAMISGATETSAGKSAIEPGDSAAIGQIMELLPESGSKMRIAQKGAVHAESFGGKSMVLPNEATRLGQISTKDAIIIVDKITSITNYENMIQNNIQKFTATGLREIRSILKKLVRNKSPDGREWARLDDKYHRFMELEGGLSDKLVGETAKADQKAFIIDNMLNKNKDPLLRRLAKALDIDLQEGQPSQATEFFARLKSKKAAEMIGSDIAVFDANADKVNRIFERWGRRGAEWGSAAGAVSGVGAAHGGVEDVIGFGLGVSIGRAGGRAVGEAIGRRLGDPMRVLATAEKAKVLSNEAKEFVKDLGWIGKRFGPEAAVVASQMIKAPVPVLNELSAWTRAQEGEDN